MSIKEILDLQYKNLEEQRLLLLQNAFTVARIKQEIKNLTRNIKHLKGMIEKYEKK
jgi:hypothetical protein